MLAEVVQSWDTSCVHCVKVGKPTFTQSCLDHLMSRCLDHTELNTHTWQVSSERVITPSQRLLPKNPQYDEHPCLQQHSNPRSQQASNHRPFTQCTQLLSQLCTTAANTTRHTPHAVVYIVCSPDDGHNDARNMLS